MGTATLGFAGGPAVAFRLDPDSIEWDWEINTNVIDTIGGRVVQVLGATLNDLTVTGSFGQDHSTPQGVSWRQAEAFLRLVTQIMEFQSQDATQQDRMQAPAIFTYPPKNWRFRVYVKGLSDPDGGGSIVLSPGKFSHRYALTLFIVQEASDALVAAGTSNGVLSKKSAEAIAAYMARISDGIGWHFSQYNGHVGASPPAKGKGGPPKKGPPPPKRPGGGPVIRPG